MLPYTTIKNDPMMMKIERKKRNQGLERMPIKMSPTTRSRGLSVFVPCMINLSFLEVAIYYTVVDLAS